MNFEAQNILKICMNLNLNCASIRSSQNPIQENNGNRFRSTEDIEAAVPYERFINPCPLDVAYMR